MRQSILTFILIIIAVIAIAESEEPLPLTLERKMQEYNKAIELNPKNGSAYQKRGVLKNAQRDYKGAN